MSDPAQLADDYVEAMGAANHQLAIDRARAGVLYDHMMRAAHKAHVLAVTAATKALREQTEQSGD